MNVKCASVLLSPQETFHLLYSVFESRTCKHFASLTTNYLDLHCFKRGPKDGFHAGSRDFRLKVWDGIAATKVVSTQGH